MREIVRRDVLNGVAVSLAAGAIPRAALAQGTTVDPPALTGMRGSTDASFSVIHALAREGKAFDAADAKAEERYDLIVVGAGLAGLTAAWEYRDRHRSARILILDNHDDFGGHARRCEFNVDGRLILGYAGSESMVSPRSKYKGRALQVLKAIGIDPEIFYSDAVFHRSLYPGLGLSRGIFLPKETFGADRLVTGDPMVLSFDEFGGRVPNARPIEAVLDDCPLSEPARRGLKELFAGTRDYLSGKPKAEKLSDLARMSYRAFLVDVCGLPKDAADFLQGRSNDNFGFGIDVIPASDAMSGGFPGAKALHLEAELKDEEAGSEPYVHHFPDGNATIARALVRSLINGSAPGRTAADLVTAQFRYGALDVAGQRVRLRLQSTVTSVRNVAGGVDVVYVRDGRPHRVAARRAIVATYASVMPYICPDIPAERAALLRENVKAPIVYTKVILSSWQAFVAAGVHSIAAPMSFHSTVKLDYPVSLGAYRFPRKPDEPIGLQLVHVPVAPGSGLDARAQSRVGRQRLLETSFAELEARIREDLSRMLAGTGFDAGSQIRAITVNRWSHGYSYAPNSLFDDVEAMTKAKPELGRRIGAIGFANSDTLLDAYAHTAMSEAIRAARDLG